MFAFSRPLHPILNRWLFWAVLVVFSLPVLLGWFHFLASRSWLQNGLQGGSALCIILAIWFRRKTAPQGALSPSPSLLGFSCGLVLGLLHFIMDFYGIQSGYWASYLLLLTSICWAVSGFQYTLQWLPFFMFSVFLLPVVHAEIIMTISLPLQLCSTWLAATVSSLLIPITQHHNFLYIRSQVFEITADCSGLHSWMGFIFAGLLRQLFEGTKLLELGLLFPFSLMLALLLNGLRLAITALVAYYASSDQAVAIHTNLDYLLLPIGFFCLWEGGNWLSRHLSSKKNLSVEPSPLTSEALPTKPKRNQWIRACVIGLLFSLSIGHWLIAPPLAPDEVPTTPATQLSWHLGNWQGKTDPLTPEEERALSGADIISREYKTPAGAKLWMLLLTSPAIHPIHNFLGCLGTQGIETRTISRFPLSSEAKRTTIPILEYDYEGEHFYEVIWYQRDNHIASNRWDWYWQILKERLHHRVYAWHIVAVTLPASAATHKKQAQAQLQEFSHLIYQHLETPSKK